MAKRPLLKNFQLITVPVYLEKLRVTFLGTGDAFGHGGRLQPCMLIETPKCRFLLDCGASAMISMELYDIRPNSIDMILVSHLHGDHFGGLPFFILDAQLHSKRTEPLLVAGPEGSNKRINLAMEVMFPGSSKVQRKFHTEVVELQPGKAWDFRDVRVLPTLVTHPSGDPSLAFRVESCQKTIVYTGDTEWTETLIPLSVDADLLIAETYFYAKQVKYHMNYETLRSHLDELYPKRVLITHMSPDMLSKLDEINLEAAEDGMVVEV